MKQLRKILLITAILSCLTAIIPIQAFASEPETVITYLDNGDYIVTEYTFSNSLARATTSGYASETYYSSDNVAKFALIIEGSFFYTYGASAYATNVSATVEIYTPDATFVSKNAYTSGNTAYGSAVVNYLGVNVPLEVGLLCAVDGSLHVI